MPTVPQWNAFLGLPACLQVMQTTAATRAKSNDLQTPLQVSASP
jgi:hypothetical protein